MISPGQPLLSSAIVQLPFFFLFHITPQPAQRQEETPDGTLSFILLQHKYFSITDLPPSYFSSMSPPGGAKYLRNKHKLPLSNNLSALVLPPLRIHRIRAYFPPYNKITEHLLTLDLYAYRTMIRPHYSIQNISAFYLFHYFSGSKKIVNPPADILCPRSGAITPP